MHCARWGDWKSQGVQRPQLKQEKGSQWGGGGTGSCRSAKTTTEAGKRLSMEGGGSATRIRLNEGGAVKKCFSFRGRVCTRLLI